MFFLSSRYDYRDSHLLSEKYKRVPCSMMFRIDDRRNNDFQQNSEVPMTMFPTMRFEES
jgi:hypothetical protein